ncbi:hypothetical protein EVJ58_g11088 [Rhodofomes roseus]|nr:hypothetical protein EVJ58_g11088 [Rhodofomes roseus]
MLSDVGSEATLVPVRGCGNANDMKNLGAKMELGQHFEWNEAVEEFLQSVLAIVPHQ